MYCISLHSVYTETLCASQLVVARIVLLARHVVLALALLDLGPLQAGHVPQGARWCSGEVLLVLAEGQSGLDWRSADLPNAAIRSACNGCARCSRWRQAAVHMESVQLVSHAHRVEQILASKRKSANGVMVAR